MGKRRLHPSRMREGKCFAMIKLICEENGREVGAVSRNANILLEGKKGRCWTNMRLVCDLRSSPLVSQRVLTDAI